MKLSALKQSVARDEEGVDLQILDENDEPYVASDGTPTVFVITGLQTAARQKVEDDESRKMTRKGIDSMEGDDWRRSRLNRTAACVIGMRGWEDDDGHPVPFNQTNVKIILQTDARILVQLEKGIARHAQLFPKPSVT